MNPNLFEVEDIRKALALRDIPDAQAMAWRWHKPLREAMVAFNINSHLRQAHWLAQLCHESAGLRILEENLNYSAKGLLKVFPRYFNWVTARTHAGKPQAIANRVYDDRNPKRINKLGNTRDGDGWLYRGRGLIQLTGREAYRNIGALIGMDLEGNPDLAASPTYAALIAGRVWRTKGLERWADRDSLEQVTIGINGGTNGIDDRRAWLNVWKQVLGEKS